MTFHAMKKHLFTLIAMLLGMAMTVEADEIKGLTLGYCDGVAVGSGKIGTTDKDAWNSLAVRIPAGEMKTYAGCHIDSLRMALASKINVDSVVMWLRSHGGGRPRRWSCPPTGSGRSSAPTRCPPWWSRASRRRWA